MVPLLCPLCPPRPAKPRTRHSPPCVHTRLTPFEPRRLPLFDRPFVTPRHARMGGRQRVNPAVVGGSGPCWALDTVWAEGVRGPEGTTPWRRGVAPAIPGGVQGQQRRRDYRWGVGWVGTLWCRINDVVDGMNTVPSKNQPLSGGRFGQLNRIKLDAAAKKQPNTTDITHRFPPTSPPATPWADPLHPTPDRSAPV